MITVTPVLFLKFINKYNFGDTYLTNDRRVISDIIGTYTEFLLDGFTIKMMY